MTCFAISNLARGHQWSRILLSWIAFSGLDIHVLETVTDFASSGLIREMGGSP